MSKPHRHRNNASLLLICVKPNKIRTAEPRQHNEFLRISSNFKTVSKIMSPEFSIYMTDIMIYSNCMSTVSRANNSLIEVPMHNTNQNSCSADAHTFLKPNARLATRRNPTPPNWHLGWVGLSRVASYKHVMGLRRRPTADDCRRRSVGSSWRL